MKSDRTYDILNKIQRWLPALGAAYVALCNIWKLPLGSQVNDTIVVLATLLATTLEIANSNYNNKLKQ